MMTSTGLLDALGYLESPNFLRGNRLDSVSGYSHIFRRAARYCSLTGVYALASPKNERTVVPTVYVCEAESETAADDIHKKVWNQNVVPFLVVTTPEVVKLYSGFRYADRESSPATSSEASGILDAAIEFNEVAEKLRHFHAHAIDDGILWREWGGKVTPEARLDWQLLNNLKTLDQKLQARGADKDKAHALIGKYVYLRYLRDRDIISDRKLDQWGIKLGDVFGRNARIDALTELVDQVERWLNGSVFPLALDPLSGDDASFLRMVAGTFMGDEPAGQMFLNFKAYNFSYIPIETLSVIYEQFLHSTGSGKDVGAYYTPLPLVNFMLEELDDRRPLTSEMKVLDPACGSGAFLVQCYRRLIEREIRSTDSTTPPERLRELLTASVFGVDQDPDACAVAELSLILTLLDYVNPPDLYDNDSFKLPALRNRNVFHGNFFDEPPPWQAAAGPLEFDWVVGNPPWKEVDKKQIKPHEEAPVRWMEANRRKHPVGRLQLAEAFAWRSTWYMGPRSLTGLLLPATTLFKNDASRFRRAFFGGLDVWCIVNFANLRHVLFRDATQPAAAFFYTKSADLKRRFSDSESVITYSPMLANQEAGRHAETAKSGEMWAVVVNAGEIQYVPIAEASSGDALPWKLAMWGTSRDQRLVRLLGKRFPSLAKFLKARSLYRSQGVQLRDESSSEALDFIEELVEKKKLDVKRLRGYSHVFSFPPESLSIIERRGANVRKGRTKPIPACRPPHVIVSAAGSFAVFSDEFIAHPHPHFGISGDAGQERLLKALTLFLRSDFSTYYQFLSTPLWGVERTRIELGPLLSIPTPLGTLKDADLDSWVAIHDELAAIPPVAPRSREDLGSLKRAALLEKLNGLVYDALGIGGRERCIVDDFIRVRLSLNDGQLGEAAIRAATETELRVYGDTLRTELDAFVQPDRGAGHRTTIVHDDLSAMAQISFTDDLAAAPTTVVLRADEPTAQEFLKMRENLLAERGQWFYFNRNLRLYRGRESFLFKPMQHLHWTQSQALTDASTVVAETITATGGQG